MPSRVRAAGGPGRRRRGSRGRARRTVTSVIVNAGTVGWAPPSIVWAKRSHNERPTTMPTGTPTTLPIPTAMVDCHATTEASCRRVKPIVLNRARLRRRRRTDATNVSPNVTGAPVRRVPRRGTRGTWPGGTDSSRSRPDAVRRSARSRHRRGGGQVRVDRSQRAPPRIAVHTGLEPTNEYGIGSRNLAVLARCARRRDDLVGEQRRRSPWSVCGLPASPIVGIVAVPDDAERVG